MKLSSQCSSEAVTISSPNETHHPVIELKRVSKRFVDIRALTDVSLSVSPGEIYGLLGPNGAGKSTTINLICGLLRPSEGDISVAGCNTVTDPGGAKRAMGVVPQELALYTELSARENLLFFGRLYGLRGESLEARIEEMLTMVHLEGRDKASVGSFSGGMQRRLNIAAAMLHNPRVVLMDEPTVGLDPQNRENILEIVENIARAGAAVLYSTHYMDEVERICGRIGIIDHGRLLIEGSLAELRLHSGGKQILTMRGSFDAAKAVAAFQLLPGENLLKSSSEEIVFNTLLNTAGSEGRLSSFLEAASRIGEVREVAMNRQSLESLFIQLTGRELRE